jgi:streptogramin lyase
LRVPNAVNAHHARFIAAAVASAAAAVGGYFLVSEIGSKPARGFAVVNIDLTNAGALRRGLDRRTRLQKRYLIGGRRAHPTRHLNGISVS